VLSLSLSGWIDGLLTQRHSFKIQSKMKKKNEPSLFQANVSLTTALILASTFLPIKWYEASCSMALCFVVCVFCWWFCVLHLVYSSILKNGEKLVNWLYMRCVCCWYLYLYWVNFYKLFLEKKREFWKTLMKVHLFI
jgi:hypothetical protein